LLPAICECGFLRPVTPQVRQQEVKIIREGGKELNATGKEKMHLCWTIINIKMDHNHSSQFKVVFELTVQYYRTRIAL
jgi:hypothetical protein